MDEDYSKEKRRDKIIYVLETRFDKQTKLWSKSPKTQRSFGQKPGKNGIERQRERVRKKWKNTEKNDNWIKSNG